MSAPFHITCAISYDMCHSTTHVPLHITFAISYDMCHFISHVPLHITCAISYHMCHFVSHMLSLQEVRLAGIPPLPSCWDHRQRSRSWTVPLQLPCLSTVRCKVILMFCSGQHLLLLLMHYTLLSADQTNRVEPQVKSAFHVTSWIGSCRVVTGCARLMSSACQLTLCVCVGLLLIRRNCCRLLEVSFFYCLFAYVLAHFVLCCVSRPASD